MHNNRLLPLLVFISIVLGCKNSPPIVAQTINIIPIPLKQELTDGLFVLSSETALEFEETFKVSTHFLKTYITNSSQIKLKDSNGENTILFIKDTLLSNKEAYRLEITPKVIKIRAATDQGAFYAVQSLRQLLPVSFENKKVTSQKVGIQCLIIEDQPTFSYRGMHLDVSRHFFSVDFIKQYIDALALLKMNTFHWHLTDDQGWRIEIKKYPKLNKIAAFRKETLIGHYNNQPHKFDGEKYGGYYTQEEIKEVVKYASNRMITIIPEVEMPGHSQAAIAAYPELGCIGDSVDVATKWGVFETIYCTKEDTFTFLEAVLDEVLELFPSKYIHIGGDEAPKTRWKTCKHCQSRIQNEGLKDEHELQSYFISRIESYLNNKGRTIIGWDEILEGGLAPNATVMSWRGTKGAVAAANAQHDVINTTTSHCYFDYYQSSNQDEPVAIGGFLPLEKVYAFNPIPKKLPKSKHKYVLGAQGNVWTEYMNSEKEVEYMVFPRIMAMSESLWSQQERKDYSNFAARVEVFYKRLEALNINYANHLYEINGQLNTVNKRHYYALNTVLKDKIIRFTLNGSLPTISSNIYNKPIPVTKSLMLKAAVFNSKIQLGKVFSQSINYHKAVGKKININTEPHKAYNGSGKTGLINGINGSNNRFGDKEWLGFWGDDLEITIDLGKLTKINSIQTRFYNANGQWVYAPEEIGLRFETDDFKEYINFVFTIPQSNDAIVNFEFKESDLKARYIYLKIPSFGLIPEGAQGAGQKAWTFIDEIIVK